jgi:hypothetical protein
LSRCAGLTAIHKANKSIRPRRAVQQENQPYPKTPGNEWFRPGYSTIPTKLAGEDHYRSEWQRVLSRDRTVRRYWLGAAPVTRRNCWAAWLASRHPTARAITATERCVVTSNNAIFRTRTSIKNTAGVTPSAATKTCLNHDGDKNTRAANCASVHRRSGQARSKPTTVRTSVRARASEPSRTSRRTESGDDAVAVTARSRFETATLNTGPRKTALLTGHTLR